MDLDELALHPKLVVFQTATEADFERLKESLRQHGPIDPIEVSPFDAPEYPGRVLDGKHRLRALSDLGFVQAPIRVIATAQTLADQALHALAKSTRKKLTQAQLAAQEAEVRRIVENAPEKWRIERGYRGLGTDAIVAKLLPDSGSERTARRRKKIFAASVPKVLQQAVVERFISVKCAYEWILEAERTHGADSIGAHRMLRERVARERRLAKDRTRRRRAPRMPKNLDEEAAKAKRDRREYWEQLRTGFAAYATADVDLRNPATKRAAELEIREFLVDASLRAEELRRRLRRIAKPTPERSALTSSLQNWRVEMNALLRVLGLPSLAPRGSLDLRATKKRYRQLARDTHPDHHPNDPAAAARFIEYQSAMERIEELAVYGN